MKVVLFNATKTLMTELHIPVNRKAEIIVYDGAVFVLAETPAEIKEICYVQESNTVFVDPYEQPVH
jgi:hypothetical protein